VRCLARRFALTLLLAPSALLAALACSIGRTEPVEIAVRPAPPPQVISTPVKAHLLDGTNVIFPAGASIGEGALTGTGSRFGLRNEPLGRVDRIPLDSVAGLESFVRRTDTGASVAASTLGIVVGAAAVAVLAVAIFGSCPTVYADSAGVPVLEAEAFSYSIAPLFEARDVDRIRAQPGPDGVLRLEIRNEAAETHLINHLELLEVAHAAGERVTPDDRGLPWAARNLRPLPGVQDRGGRDVRAILSTDDGEAFASSPERLDAATAGDLRDWVEFELPSSPADTALLFIRARNSLLTTVLLYDVMLASQGAAAVDWVGRDLADLGTAVELGRWYAETMGIRVERRAGDRWETVGWMRDVGPIAFEEVAVAVPLRRDAATRFRLSFPVDNWRIDRIAWSAEVARPAWTIVPLARLSAPGSEGVEPDAPLLLGLPDQRYLETRPGASITVEFETTPGGSPRTYLLAMQGYYIEWIRPGWLSGLDGAPPRAGFSPGEGALAEAVDRWRVGRRWWEQRFAATQFPVR